MRKGIHMAAIFVRTILIYILLIGAMRLSGKRQIGEIQLSELVTTFLLSEIASHPLTNANIPFFIFGRSDCRHHLP